MQIQNERFAYPRERINARKAFSRCYLALVVFMTVAAVIISGVSIASIVLLGPEAALGLMSNPYVQYGLQVVVMYMIAFPLFLLITHGLPKTNYKKRHLGFGEFVAVFFISCFAVTVGSLISSLIAYFIPSSSSGVVDSFVMDAPMWLIIAVVVIIGPIVEEIAFRKILIDRLGIYGDRLAVFVSSVTFGLFHGNIEQLFYATVLGVIFGYVYIRTRNIIYPIILHILINFLGSVPALLMTSTLADLEAMGENAMLAGFEAIEFIVSVGLFLLVRYGFALAGMAVLLYCIFAGKISFPRGRVVRLKAGTVARSVLFNIGAIIFYVYFGLEIALSVNPDLLSFLNA